MGTSFWFGSKTWISPERSENVVRGGSHRNCMRLPRTSSRLCSGSRLDPPFAAPDKDVGQLSRSATRAIRAPDTIVATLSFVLVLNVDLRRTIEMATELFTLTTLGTFAGATAA